MIRTALRVIRHLTTGKDNATPDVIRIGGILMGAQFLALATYDVIALGHAFSPTDYGAGAAALLAAIGTALRIKQSTEPE
ncbi:hypothetical protein QUC32_23050 [Novosphingobium resinovorum]|uniref:hypothetical protein n=1 Tax=Novosphingobium TaxID=165696 RepID=UPI001B3CA274|nr:MULTISPECIES: hypothetical protein [Novosphingobium]MBF7012529.1 hypothetical protein [Novosphingobium sp. HR1a]WJM27263.1 hypothetical protein QUC32_23050 [Novosphingobium resinovorum]